MTRKSFSEATGISVSYLSEVERDLKRPAVDIILKISNAFNISVADIIGDSLVTPLNPEMKDLVETLRNFKPDRIRQLNEFLKTIK